MIPGGGRSPSAVVPTIGTQAAFGMTMVDGGESVVRAEARRGSGAGVLRLPRVSVELFDQMATCYSGEQASPSGSWSAALRRALGVFRIIFRSTRAAWRGTYPKRFMKVGSVLVLDHPSEDLRDHLSAIGFDGEIDSLTGALPVSARVRTFGWVVVFLVTNLDVLVRFCIRYRARSRVEQLAFKSIVSYARGREALQRFSPAAVMVSHDIGGPPYFLALAAQHAGISAWLLLHDFPKPPTDLLIRPAGAVVYAAHDACQLRPRPPRVFVYPERHVRRVPRGGRLRVGVVLPNRAESDLLALASPLIDLVSSLEGVDEVIVRPHPADPRPKYLGNKFLNQTVQGGTIVAFLSQCDLVIMVGDTAARWSAARLALRAFQIPTADRIAALLNAGQNSGLRNLWDLTSRLDVAAEPPRDSCPDLSHSREMPMSEFLSVLTAR